VPKTIISNTPLLNEETRGNGRAVSFRTAISLLGRNSILYELASGSSPNGQPFALNPQGRAGVDRSGPPWGTAHRHTVWSHEGGDTTTDIYGIAPAIVLSTAGEKKRILANFNCRPFAPSNNAPYSRLQLDVCAVRVGGAGTAVVSIKVWQTNEGDSGPYQSATITLNSASKFNFTTSPFIMCNPRNNLRIIEITLDSESGGATGAEIYSLSLNQVVRNSH
jgi:hypothetical protein